MKNDNILKNNAISGLIWKLLENFGTQLISFAIQIVLARILFPADYGIIAITVVFVSVANVFIQTGFSAALIQRKEISESDCSSVFYSGLIVSTILYIILFLLAPAISIFYDEAKLIAIFRVQSLSLIFGGLTSVHNTLLTRDLQFRKSFSKSIIAVAMQGIVGITLAVLGYGVWSLVWANIVNYTVSTIIVWKIVDWRPKLDRKSVV